MPTRFHPPSLAELERIAREAFAAIPEKFRNAVGDVVIRVEDFPDEHTEREMGLESPFDLLGLYRGVSIGHKFSGATPHDIDMIFLYRRPILEYWSETGDDLREIVRHVLVHEIGHHLGFSDDDMEAIEHEASEET